MARTKRIPAIALLVSGGLLLSGCGVVDDLFGDGAGPPPVREEFPYVREGRIFQDTGRDEVMRFAITGLERTPDHTVMYYEVGYPDGFTGSNRNLSMAHTLVDPITGRVYRQYFDDEGLKYGSVSPDGNGLYPVHDGTVNEYRRYFPPIPEEVRQVTFIGSGLGAMTGIPIQDVDEERPDPTDPNGPDHLSLSDPPPPGENLVFANRRPDDGAAADEGWVESFVDSEIASITRDGDTETISLHSDVMFEFDEFDLTDEAEAVVRQAAASLARNVDPDDPEITVIGHTDGKGGDDYNATLSVRRAETVRDLLAEEIGGGYTFEVEGRGSTEPVAREGGADDEAARARNRRVEFSYTIAGPEEPEEEDDDDDGLGVARRNVDWPAPFTDDNGDVVATAERDGVRLDVYPLRRDGAYVIGTVALTNTTDEPLTPDMGGAGALQAGGPEQFSKGTLGGFQLLEPETGLVRYVAQMNFGDGTYSGFAEEVHELQPGNTYDLVAVFPAPSDDVEELTLRAGPFGEIPEVPVGE
ncbi:OmpA family protein [Actinorugispora endophytica]|uniref:OmpA family protein n=1 Tax=Actinorugispora endophytica TaxID=1605990 RepID=A0A4R6UYS1_9ACTN|nr:OmpA family protein [Actinorugispora endophytica]TDQ50735.1 OmpA family protein [Actinorugispora endophytica]